MSTKVNSRFLHSIFKKEGMIKAKWLPSHQVRGWGHWSEGYRIRNVKKTDGLLSHICVSYTCGEYHNVSLLKNLKEILMKSDIPFKDEGAFLTVYVDQ